MSAELDALDRSVIDAGVIAAEALARVEVVEARVTEIFRLMQDQTTAWETWREVTRPQPPTRPVHRPERHLTVVKP